jgi:hypothetical protein
MDVKIAAKKVDTFFKKGFDIRNVRDSSLQNSKKYLNTDLKFKINGGANEKIQIFSHTGAGSHLFAGPYEPNS